MERRVFENLHIEDPDKPIGAGAERRVYEDKQNPEQVVALQREFIASTPAEARARFWLIKLAHLLLPNNIPDIHFSYSEPDALGRDKVELGEDHALMAKKMLILDKQIVSDVPVDFPSKQIRNDANEAGHRVSRDVRVESLMRKLFDFGFTAEGSSVNFGFNKQGEPQYVDTFNLWEIFESAGHKTFRRLYSPEKLKGAIATLPEKEQHEGEVFFERLENAFLEEKTRIEKARVM